jgi:HlyD family secretion protein
MRWLGGTIFLGLAGFGGWWFYRSNFPTEVKTTPIETLTVTKGSVEDKLSGERGIVELEGQITLKSPTDGTVEQIAAILGNTVKSGQSLVFLRDPDKETQILEHKYKLQTQELILGQKRQQLKQANLNLEEANNNLNRQLQRTAQIEKINLQKKQWEIDKQKFIVIQAQQKLEQANRELKETQAKLREDEKLLAKGYIAEDQLQDQIRNLRNDQANLANAEIELKQVNMEVAQLELDLQILRDNIAQKLTENQENIRQANKQVIDAENAVKQAESELTLAQLELEKVKLEGQKITKKSGENIISAPINGKILDILVKKGDVVKLGDDLLTLGNPNQEIVKLQLSTLNAPKVKPLQIANVSIIGPNAQTFTAKVDTVSLLAKPEKGGNSQQVKVPATIKLDQPTGVLIPGIAVNVDIILQQKKDVIIIPLDAIKDEGNGAFVWIKTPDNKAQKKTVSLGLEGLSEVEITSGLKVGDQVLLPSPEQILEEGMTVNN